jgi:hypothetical protein
MDSCQLIRKETKLKVVHINQKQLAARWCISEAALERWRSEGIGPKFLKLCGRVLYWQVDIEAYEASCLHVSTSQVAVARVQSNGNREPLVRRIEIRHAPKCTLVLGDSFAGDVVRALEWLGPDPVEQAVGKLLGGVGQG